MSEYEDDERETTASLNNNSIRELLKYRRKWGRLSEGQMQMLQKYLKKRRSYQRDAKIRVWEMDCGADGKLLFDDKDEMLMWAADDEIEYRMIWMSGREFGHLEIADWI